MLVCLSDNKFSIPFAGVGVKLHTGTAQNGDPKGRTTLRVAELLINYPQVGKTSFCVTRISSKAGTTARTQTLLDIQLLSNDK
jgi:hypothetical protein